MASGQPSPASRAYLPVTPVTLFWKQLLPGANAPNGWRGTDSRDFEDDNRNYTLQDSLLWLKDKHSFKFGFQYQRVKDNTKTNDTGSLFIANFGNRQTAGFNAAGGLLTATGQRVCQLFAGCCEFGNRQSGFGSCYRRAVQQLFLVGGRRL